MAVQLQLGAIITMINWVEFDLLQILATKIVVEIIFSEISSKITEFQVISVDLK
jgi:hypothetical protein